MSRELKLNPVLKWAGGKRHIAEEIMSYFPKDWETGKYFEPFLGGAALAIFLQPKGAKLSDLNSNLINFYKFLRNDKEKLISELHKISEEFNTLPEEKRSEYFYKLREEFNTLESQNLRKSALMFSLNKLCFNGLYRENSKGKFNVPFGNKKRFPAIDEENLFAVSELLKSNEIENSDFREIESQVKKGDFVYFDPPYIPVNVTSSFTAYQSNGFTDANQVELSELMSRLSKIGVRCLCSNSDTPLTRKIYGAHRLIEIKAPRMVSAKSSGRGMISELLIANY